MTPSSWLRELARLLVAAQAACAKNKMTALAVSETPARAVGSEVRREHATPTS